MINYYTVLQIPPTATQNDIKKAYRRLAMTSHPDKGGDPEQFNIITKAYDTLCDLNERAVYDRDLEVLNDDAFEYNPNRPIAGHLQTKAPAYSKEYKDLHARIVLDYKTKPLEKRKAEDICVKPFSSECYEYKFTNTQQTKFHDIYSLNKQKALDTNNIPPLQIPRTLPALTPDRATTILATFLKGTQNTQELQREIDILNTQIQKIKTQNSNPKLAKEIIFYNAVLDILSYDETMHTETKKLFLALQKITNFAKDNADEATVYMTHLFQSKYYRNFVAYVLHEYWLNPAYITSLDEFDGRIASDELVLMFREKLIKSRDSNTSSEQAVSGLRYARLLDNLEKLLHKQRAEEESRSIFYRKKAFLLLDWIPALLVTSEQSIIFNTFLQIGICFHIASTFEVDLALRRADQKLAFDCYKTAANKAQKLTPDKEFYFLIHSLKYISKLEYKFEYLTEIGLAYQHRALTIANIFPFIQAERPNVAIFVETDQPIRLMRGLLNALNNIIEDTEKKKTNNRTDFLPLDHNYVTVFYQIYEACLENWFDRHFDPEFEKSIRLKLMRELLSVNRWTFFDLDLNLDSPWVMIDRNEEGWMRPNRALPYSESQKLKNYTSIDGVEFNYATGELSFSLKGWEKDDLDYDNLICLHDITELFETNMTGGFFSLDPVDPDMQYHPYNKMRFKPARLNRTQLFHSMLITDYLLKFFTTGQEIQGRHPYDMKSLENLTQKLPRYLKDIIENYQTSPSTHGLHRFWIEAGEINVAVNESKEDVVQYAYDDLQMVVKKHKMFRDVDGEIHDLGADIEDEGWDFYVSTRTQKAQLESSDISTLKPAIIFITDTDQFYFVENEEFSSAYTLHRCDHHLKNLAKLKRDDKQKVELTPANQRLFYRLTREAAKQTGKSHRYSREFIFAQEFTNHYNEFAQYFPEFGRLRELSKAVALVRAMDAQHEGNNKIIEKITASLTDAGIEEARNKIKPEVSKSVKEQVEEWKKEYSRAVISQEKTKMLRELRKDIGSMSFTRNSPEIKAMCNKANDDLKRQVTAKGGSWSSMSSQVWTQHIEPEIPNWIRQATQQKYASCLKQLTEAFAKALKNTYSPERPIKAFLEGNDTLLLNVLIEYQQGEIHQQIAEKAFKNGVSATTIGMAINGSAADLNQIITYVMKENIEKHKAELRQILAKHEKMRNSFKKLGFAQHEAEPGLEHTCLWVPASIKHDLNDSHSHLVYGGVSVNPQIQMLAQNSHQAQILANHAFANQNQMRVNAAQMQNGNGGPSGGNPGGSGGNGSGGNANPQNRVQHEAMKAQMRQDMEKPIAQDPKVQTVIDNFYRRGAEVGSGSTAAAIRHELSTGNLVNGRSHLEKGQQNIVFLERWLRNNSTAAPGDRAAIENIVHDLNDALGYINRPRPRNY